MTIKKYFNQRLTISEVIDIAETFNNDDSNMFATFPCIYGKDEVLINLDTICFLDDYPEIIDDKELFPKYVLENNLELLCSGENFIDVYDYVVENTKNFNKEQFINALNYYLEYDDFLDFD